MATPYLCEIRIMSFGFAPKGWAQCNGQLLPIAQNQALFALLGTTYGGDGRVNFGLPNLQGRAALHMGAGYSLGQLGGEAAHTLTIGEVPTHTHTAVGTPTAGDSPIADANYLGSADDVYGAAVDLVNLNLASVSTTGGSQAHENMQPYLVLNFCIALQGIFPTQN